MEELQLKLGKMAREELARWFNIKPQTYTRSRKKKLEELKIFADFKEIYGGVEITNIKIPIYAKRGPRAYNIIKENFSNA